VSEPKLCSLCGERPVREADKMMCAPCFERVDGNYQRAKRPSE